MVETEFKINDIQTQRNFINQKDLPISPPDSEHLLVRQKIKRGKKSLKQKQNEINQHYGVSPRDSVQKVKKNK